MFVIQIAISLQVCGSISRVCFRVVEISRAHQRVKVPCLKGTNGILLCPFSCLFKAVLPVVENIVLYFVKQNNSLYFYLQNNQK